MGANKKQNPPDPSAQIVAARIRRRPDRDGPLPQQLIRSDPSRAEPIRAGGGRGRSAPGPAEGGEGRGGSVPRQKVAQGGKRGGGGGGRRGRAAGWSPGKPHASAQVTAEPVQTYRRPPVPEPPKPPATRAAAPAPPKDKPAKIIIINP